MIIRLMQTGELADVEEGYALRLIEQGKAVTYQKPTVDKTEDKEAEKKPAPKKKG